MPDDHQQTITFRDQQELLEAVFQIVGGEVLRDFVITHLADGRITTQQAAHYLQVSRPTVIKLVEQGKIPHIKVGNRRYLSLSDVEQYRLNAGGVIREEFPQPPVDLRAANMRALVQLAEEQGDFDSEQGTMPTFERD